MQPDKSLIDIHCHTAGIGAGASGCFLSPALRRNWRFPLYLKAYGVTQADLLREGDGLVLRRISELLAQSRRVDKAVVLALDGVVDASGALDIERTECHVPNEFLAAEVRRYPNLLFGASVNPYRSDSMERLEQAAEAGAVLMKWLPPVQAIDPADQRLIPFYLRLRELGLPLLTHTGSERSFTRHRDELGDPERLRLPLGLGVEVIAAHAGGNGKTDGERHCEIFLRLCKEFPNLRADLSAMVQPNRFSGLERVLRERELHPRLLYGTDMPLINTPAVTPFAFPLRLGLSKMLEIARVKNPWDRDVALKEALGVTREILANSAKLPDRGARSTSGGPNR